VIRTPAADPYLLDPAADPWWGGGGSVVGRRRIRGGAAGGEVMVGGLRRRAGEEEAGGRAGEKRARGGWRPCPPLRTGSPGETKIASMAVSRSYRGLGNDAGETILTSLLPFSCKNTLYADVSLH
jgi:hypothetical protein